MEAFLHGALGPDMGYFAPGLRWLSDLIHRDRSADLARALLAEAGDPVQQAYAWGWLTHVLADTAVHPLINRAAGELIAPARGRPLMPAEHPAAHLRVELGLDAYVAARAGGLEDGRLAADSGPGDMTFLVTALHRTYGAVVPPEDVVRGHRAMRRLVPLLLALGRVAAAATCIARRWCPMRGPAAGCGRDRFAPAEGYLSLAGAFVSPAPPSPWLIAAVTRRMRHFGEEFLLHVDTGLRELRNHDLDSGTSLDEVDPEARARLVREGGGSPLRVVGVWG